METDRLITEDKEELQFMKKFFTAIIVIESAVGALLTVSNIVIAVALTKISWLLQVYCY